MPGSYSSVCVELSWPNMHKHVMQWHTYRTKPTYTTFHTTQSEIHTQKRMQRTVISAKIDTRFCFQLPFCVTLTFRRLLWFICMNQNWHRSVHCAVHYATNISYIWLINCGKLRPWFYLVVFIQLRRLKCIGHAQSCGLSTCENCIYDIITR